VKLMEDIIKLYEKIKAFDGSREDIERRMSVINEKVSQINRSTVNTERKTLSPREPDADFLDRQAKEVRTLTANQLHLKRRKAYTTARPSVSQQGIALNVKSNKGESFASIPQVWAPPFIHDKNPSQNKISAIKSGIASGTQTEFNKAAGLTVFNQVSIKNQTLHLNEDPRQMGRFKKQSQSVLGHALGMSTGFSY
jgi:hypothetical protein